MLNFYNHRIFYIKIDRKRNDQKILRSFVCNNFKERSKQKKQWQKAPSRSFSFLNIQNVSLGKKIFNYQQEKKLQTNSNLRHFSSRIFFLSLRFLSLKLLFNLRLIFFATDRRVLLTEM
jgi:hypothetical protein